MKYNPYTHIIGKVSDLSQENMNALLDEIYRLNLMLKELRTDSLEDHQEYKRATKLYIDELRSKLAKAREALEFYADGEMIIVQQTDPLFSEIEKEMEILSDFFDAYVNDGYWIKGKRAWQVLKEIE